MVSDREEEEACNMNTKLGLGLGLGIGLGLGLGLGVDGGEYLAGDRGRREWEREREKEKEKKGSMLFALHPCEEEPMVDGYNNNSNSNMIEVEEYYGSKSKNGAKNSRNGSARKKLRLTKDQSTLLERSFKFHSTLNSTQKQTLADQLNLQPRQVEVWFQNRRARTKLKQTEVDCELLKRSCETLTNENRMLKKELQELRTLKSGPSPLYIQLPKSATLTMCPLCDKFFKSHGADWKVKKRQQQY
ncbi:homeobox-leucine zipper protein HAT14-like [Malania oleifera]|uniref:homeobox-leucine zipper protein HAT14-like n=1 Tax=Malania oleifera TaxID=397392 RepID=UPI0025AE955E|nr:homeobox-leucine zipper protein HAT14-like [Malania oleifera]